MEEKKSIKISLSTVLLFLAILVIIVMAYYIYIEKTNANKEIANLEANAANMKDTIDDLQGKIDTISNTINSSQTNNNTENNTAEQTESDNKQKIISILKNADNSEEYGQLVYFDVLKIAYENEKYNVEVEYNSPIVISENELKELKKDKKITLNNEDYEYLADTDSANGYIQKNNQKYEIIKYSDGYAFVLSGTAGGYTWTINKKENMKFIADENTVIYDKFVEQEYKLKDEKAKDWLNKSLENTIIRLNYSDDLGLSIYIDNK